MEGIILNGRVFNNNVIKSEDANSIPVPSTKDTMELVIKYLHTGKMEYKDFTLKEILDLLKLLEFMGEENLFSAVEEFTLNQIRNKEFSHEKILLMASTSEKFKFVHITRGILHLIRDDIEEIADLPEVKYLTSSLLEKIILLHDLLDGDDDVEDDTDDADKESGNDDNGVRVENEEKVDTANYIDKFKTFMNWLSGNQNCSQEFKEKMVNLFKLEHFTSSELSTCVRQSSLYSDSELMDVLREKIVAMVNDQAALVKEKCSLVREKKALDRRLCLELLDLENKLAMVEHEKNGLQLKLNKYKSCGSYNCYRGCHYHCD